MVALHQLGTHVSTPIALTPNLDEIVSATPTQWPCRPESIRRALVGQAPARRWPTVRYGLPTITVGCASWHVFLADSGRVMRLEIVEEVAHLVRTRPVPQGLDGRRLRAPTIPPPAQRWGAAPNYQLDTVGIDDRRPIQAPRGRVPLSKASVET